MCPLLSVYLSGFLWEFPWGWWWGYLLLLRFGSKSGSQLVNHLELRSEFLSVSQLGLRLVLVKGSLLDRMMPAEDLAGN